MAIPTIRAGWLLRESSVLKQWKRSWFVLYGDGNLAYFKDETLQEREGNFSIPHTCLGLKTALECEVTPPENRNYGTLLKLVSRTNVSLVVSASSGDEALAWKLMIEHFLVKPQQQQQRPPANIPPGSQTRVAQYTTYPYGASTVQTTNVSAGSPYPVQQNVPVYYYPNYGAVQVQYDSSGRPYYVHPHTQVITVVRENDPYYYRTGNVMLGAAAGAMVGAALWAPFWFF